MHDRIACLLESSASDRGYLSTLGHLDNSIHLERHAQRLHTGHGVFVSVYADDPGHRLLRKESSIRPRRKVPGNVPEGGDIVYKITSMIRMKPAAASQAHGAS